MQGAGAAGYGNNDYGDNIDNHNRKSKKKKKGGNTKGRKTNDDTNEYHTHTKPAAPRLQLVVERSNISGVEMLRHFFPIW